MTVRQQILEQAVKDLTDEELEFVIEKIGVKRAHGALSRIMDRDEPTMMARQNMPGSFNINGVTYNRQQS